MKAEQDPPVASGPYEDIDMYKHMYLTNTYTPLNRPLETILMFRQHLGFGF